MKLKQFDFLSYEWHNHGLTEFGSKQMGLVPPKLDNLLNFKGKFIPHSLFFNAISKRIKLESWDWSQIEGDLL